MARKHRIGILFFSLIMVSLFFFFAERLGLLLCLSLNSGWKQIPSELLHHRHHHHHHHHFFHRA